MRSGWLFLSSLPQLTLISSSQTQKDEAAYFCSDLFCIFFLPGKILLNYHLAVHYCN